MYMVMAFHQKPLCVSLKSDKRLEFFPHKTIATLNLLETFGTFTFFDHLLAVFFFPCLCRHIAVILGASSPTSDQWNSVKRWEFWISDTAVWFTCWHLMKDNGSPLLERPHQNTAWALLTSDNKPTSVSISPVLKGKLQGHGTPPGRGEAIFKVLHAWGSQN